MDAISANEERVPNLIRNILDATPEICFERAVLLTQSYRETEGEPVILRRAKALDKILSEMTVYIQEDELIVGNLASKPLSAPFFPEYGWEKSLDTLINERLDAYQNRGNSIIDELNKNLADVLPYWEGNTVFDEAEARYSDKARKAQKSFMLNFHAAMNGLGHITVDYARVLNQGLNGIIEEAEAKLDRVNNGDMASLSKRQFLEAVIISLNACIKFANRLSEKAKQLALNGGDIRRREELLKISEVCARVPGEPATSFWEALQSFWFIQLILQIETNGHSVSPGRLDQYLYPFYAGDIQSQANTEDQAQELLDCLWVKFNDTNKLKAHALLTPSVIDSQGCFFPYQLFQNVSIGGQTAEGDDATNELSYMCLNATERVKLPQPSLTVRSYTGAPEKFVSRTFEVIRHGLGMPQFFNDDVVIAAKANKGVAIEDARDYSILGCVELGIPGKELNFITGNIVNLAKCLELALSNGIDHTGIQAGPATGDVALFDTYDAVWDAFCAQVTHAAKMLVDSSEVASEAHRKIAPRPFMSALVSDCIKRGKTLLDGGARYSFISARGIGLPNVADGLAAIKKIVFEDRLMTMGELKKLLMEDFEGKEDLRQLLLNKAPKYGNDDDAVDTIAKKVGDFFCKAFENYETATGAKWQAGLWSSADSVACGVVVGATPDGRKKGDILADNISPVQGRDRKGPTASARSAAKLDHVAASDGTSFHIKLHPAVLEGEQGIKRVASFKESFFNMGAMNCQINVLSAETLRDAQQNPDMYRDLVVRVAGFSAFFTRLDKKTQEDIIRRTEYGQLS